MGKYSAEGGTAERTRIVILHSLSITVVVACCSDFGSGPIAPSLARLLSPIAIASSLLPLSLFHARSLSLVLFRLGRPKVASRRRDGRRAAALSPSSPFLLPQKSAEGLHSHALWFRTKAVQVGGGGGRLIRVSLRGKIWEHRTER